jgi:hypothetical protein
MLEINLAQLLNLTELLAPAPSTEAGPAKEFEQLLQGMTALMEGPLPSGEGGQGPGEGASNLGTALIRPPVLDVHLLRREKALQPTDSIPQEVSAELIALQAALGILPPTPAMPAAEVKTFCETAKTKLEVPELGTPEETPKAETAAAAKQTLNLKDFDVRKFEFKTELEISTVQPKLIRIAPLPGILQPFIKPTAVQPRTAKAFSNPGESMASAATPVLERKADAPLIAAPEAVERVRVVIDPPPPPPVARTVSMDIGDAESQVRVVLRERGGQLAVQFGAATERLRDELQNAAPGLLHELRRDNTHSNVTLDFSSFGTATDAGREQPQDAPRKKPLKSEAVFADLDETAYLEENPPFSKSF